MVWMGIYDNVAEFIYYLFHFYFVLDNEAERCNKLQ